MKRWPRPEITYAAGLVSLATAGFCSPVWFLGFVPVGVGLVCAAFLEPDDEEDARGNPASSPRQ